MVRPRDDRLGDADERRRRRRARRARGARDPRRRRPAPDRRVADDGPGRRRPGAADARDPGAALARERRVRAARRPRVPARRARGAVLRRAEGDRPGADRRGRGAGRAGERPLPGRDADHDAARPRARRRPDRGRLRAVGARRRRGDLPRLGDDPAHARAATEGGAADRGGRRRPSRPALPRARAAPAALGADLRGRGHRLDGVLRQHPGPRRRALRRGPGDRGLAARRLRPRRRARQRPRLPVPPAADRRAAADRPLRARPGGAALAPGHVPLGAARGPRARALGRRQRDRQPADPLAPHPAGASAAPAERPDRADDRLRARAAARRVRRRPGARRVRAATRPRRLRGRADRCDVAHRRLVRRQPARGRAGRTRRWRSRHEPPPGSRDRGAARVTGRLGARLADDVPRAAVVRPRDDGLADEDEHRARGRARAGRDPRHPVRRGDRALGRAPLDARLGPRARTLDRVDPAPPRARLAQLPDAPRARLARRGLHGAVLRVAGADPAGARRARRACRRAGDGSRRGRPSGHLAPRAGGRGPAHRDVQRPGRPLRGRRHLPPLVRAAPGLRPAPAAAAADRRREGPARGDPLRPPRPDAARPVLHVAPGERLRPDARRGADRARLRGVLELPRRRRLLRGLRRRRRAREPRGGAARRTVRPASARCDRLRRADPAGLRARDRAAGAGDRGRARALVVLRPPRQRAADRRDHDAHAGSRAGQGDDRR